VILFSIFFAIALRTRYGYRMIKVGIVGAYGRMGSAASEAVQAAQDMELVAKIGHSDPLENLIEAGATHMIDLSVPDATENNVRFAVDNGVHAVVGATGWDSKRLEQLAGQLTAHPNVGVLIAPNFAIGAVLAMRFAEQAAKYFESAEVIEMHHPDKVDAPSGTASRTAELMGEARTRAGLAASPDATQADPSGARGATVSDVHVHAVRLRGLTAHQEVLLGNPAEMLTIRHDSFDRASFMPGVLLGVREVAAHAGLSVGLDSYLDL
jgi:4-hydroxy-tetrahydrodipicolinate reductase